MLEAWLEALGAKVVVSIHDRHDNGCGLWGWAVLGCLHVRYDWETVYLKWLTRTWCGVWDEWDELEADWRAAVPTSSEQLEWLIATAMALAAELPLGHDPWLNGGSVLITYPPPPP